MCPYHWLNKKTKCSRQFALRNPELYPGDFDRCRWGAKAWLLASPCYLRRRHHAEWAYNADEILPEEVMDEQARGLPAPPEKDELLDDDQLDELEGVVNYEGEGKSKKGKRSKGAQGAGSAGPSSRGIHAGGAGSAADGLPSGLPVEADDPGPDEQGPFDDPDSEPSSGSAVALEAAEEALAKSSSSSDSSTSSSS